MNRDRRARNPRVQEPDQVAFGELLRSHDQRLRNLVWRMVHGDPATTDDLLQDAYLRAFRSRASFTGDADAFGGWLFRITYNLCLDYLKSAQRRVEPIGAEVVRLPVGKAPVGRSAEPLIGDRVVERARVRSALSELRPDEVAAIVLIDLEGVPYDEAAELLDVPMGTLSSRVRRARIKLRGALADDTSLGDHTARSGDGVSGVSAETAPDRRPA